MFPRRRAEEAREALRLGLEKVRMIQEQAQAVPQLQSRISQLETEVRRCRYRTSCLEERGMLYFSVSCLPPDVYLRTISTFTTLRSQCSCVPDHQQLELSGDSCGKAGERLDRRRPPTTGNRAKNPSVLCLQTWSVCRGPWRVEPPPTKRRMTLGRGMKVCRR